MSEQAGSTLDIMGILKERNPDGSLVVSFGLAIAYHVSDLESRLEKAEAERDDALASRKFWMDAWHTLDRDAADLCATIRALKSSPPTPEQG